jgi:hypothetical protein
MFKSFRIGAAAAAIAATFGMTSAAHAVTATANATAEILEALDVQAVSALDFGVIAANGADTITVAPNSGVTCGANLICTGTAAAASLTVDGSAGATVAISLPSSTTTLTNIPASATMSVTGLTLSAATLTLSGSPDAFTVGGTLSVGAGQAAGTYNGTFAVDVEYQ